jgi:hypothetical protein
MGRPRKTPTNEQATQAEQLAAIGVSDADIASVMGVSEATLKNYLADRLKTGRAKGRTKIGKAMFDAALAGNVSAQVWWSKNQMGWRDQPADINSSRKLERRPLKVIPKSDRDG